MRALPFREVYSTRASEWIGDMAVWNQTHASDNSEQRARLLRNLHKVIENELTSRQRQMVEMYYFQEKNVTEIADELGLNISTVSKTLSRGKNRIRRFLKYSF